MDTRSSTATIPTVVLHHVKDARVARYPMASEIRSSIPSLGRPVSEREKMKKVLTPRAGDQDDMDKVAIQSETQGALIANFLEMGPMVGLDARSHLETVASNLEKAIATLSVSPYSSLSAGTDQTVLGCLENLRSKVFPFLAQGIACNEMLRSAIVRSADIISAIKTHELNSNGVSKSGTSCDWKVVYDSFLHQMKEEQKPNAWKDSFLDPRVADPEKLLAALSGDVTDSQDHPLLSHPKFRAMALSLSHFQTSINGLASRAMILAFSKLFRLVSFISDQGVLRKRYDSLSPAEKASFVALVDASNFAHASVRYSVIICLKNISIMDSLTREIDSSGARSMDHIFEVVAHHYLLLSEDSDITEDFFNFVLNADPVLSAEITDANMSVHRRINPLAESCLVKLREWGGFVLGLKHLLDSQIRTHLSLIRRGSSKKKDYLEGEDETIRFVRDHAGDVEQVVILEEESIFRSIKKLSKALSWNSWEKSGSGSGSSGGGGGGGGSGSGAGRAAPSSEKAGRSVTDAISSVLAKVAEPDTPVSSSPMTTQRRFSVLPKIKPLTSGSKVANAVAWDSMCIMSTHQDVQHSFLEYMSFVVRNCKSRVQKVREEVRSGQAVADLRHGVHASAEKLAAKSVLEDPESEDSYSSSQEEEIASLLSEFAEHISTVPTEYLYGGDWYSTDNSGDELAKAVYILDRNVSERLGVESERSSSRRSGAIPQGVPREGIYSKFLSRARDFMSLLGQARLVIVTKYSADRGAEASEREKKVYKILSGMGFDTSLFTRSSRSSLSGEEGEGGEGEFFLLSRRNLDRQHDSICSTFEKCRLFYSGEDVRRAPRGAAGSPSQQEVKDVIVECMKHGVGMYAWKMMTGVDVSVIPRLFQSETHLVEAFSASEVQKYQEGLERNRSRRLPISVVSGGEEDTTRTAYGSISNWAIAHAYLSTIFGHGLFPDASFSNFDASALGKPPNPGESGEYIINSVIRLVRKGHSICSGGDGPRKGEDYGWDLSPAKLEVDANYMSRYGFSGKIGPATVFCGIFSHDLLDSGVLSARFMQKGGHESLVDLFSVSTFRPLVGVRSIQLSRWLSHQVTAFGSSSSDIVRMIINAASGSSMSYDRRALDKAGFEEYEGYVLEDGRPAGDLTLYGTEDGGDPEAGSDPEETAGAAGAVGALGARWKAW